MTTGKSTTYPKELEKLTVTWKQKYLD